MAVPADLERLHRRLARRRLAELIAVRSATRRRRPPAAEGRRAEEGSARRPR